MKALHKKWFSTAIILGAFSSMGFLAACGKSDSGPTTNNGLVQTCNAQGICSYGLQQNTTLGFYAQTSSFYLPSYQNNGSSLRIQSGFYNLLKDAMGVCDRSHSSGGFASCNSWMSGAHDLVLFSDTGASASTVKLVMRSTPGNMGGGWYSYSLPDFKGFVFGILGLGTGGYAGGVFNPLVLESTIWPVNNSQGFEVRAYGPRVSAAWNKLFQLQVASGKLEDSSWSFKLFFNGALAADGTAIKCQSQYCGMDSTYFNSSN